MNELEQAVIDAAKALRVTYTPMGEPLPAERIAQLEVQLDDERAKHGVIASQRARIAQLEAELTVTSLRLKHTLMPQVAKVSVPTTTADMIERFRKALMVEHAHDWDMDTISEAAHICAKSLPQPADSDLLWGVQYSTGEVVGWHNEQDARANAANSSRAHKCLVRLRVIEVPE